MAAATMHTCASFSHHHAYLCLSQPPPCIPVPLTVTPMHTCASPPYVSVLANQPGHKAVGLVLNPYKPSVLTDLGKLCDQVAQVLGMGVQRAGNDHRGVFLTADAVTVAL
eukprot:1154027-Pelagomonas_calceolata.AAC.3